MVLVITACSNKEPSKDVELDENALDNINEEGMPIVKEPISFDIFTGSAASSPRENDWNDIFIWNEYKEMTNIDINWERVMPDSVKEKRNLALASGNIPDAFYTAGLSNLDLFKYGKQGIFVKLNDLIDEYAPNLTKLMDEYPEVRKAITMPDGNIYSLPNIQDPAFSSFLAGAKPWFNQEWLDTLQMKMPETTEDFYEYLKAVKEQDLNGNGKADEIPYGGRGMNELIRWLRGSFGLAIQNNSNIDLDPQDGTLRYIPISEEYKEMLVYINKLYNEELINQNIFTIENDQFLADGSNSLYGSTVFYGPNQTFGKGGEVYVGGYALKGPHGDQSYSKSNVVGRVDGLVITNKNENPAAMVKWVDYFYSDEGARFQYMGVKGKTYTETSDGDLEYVDDIMNSPDGLTLDEEIRKRFAFNGIWPPGLMKQEYFIGAESSKPSLKAAEKLEPHLSEESWPNFQYTVDENEVLSTAGADIGKYVEEMRDKFIVGSVPFAEWDEYVKTIENIGLEEYMDIQRAAYERYNGE